jgi:hypothetical protein
VIEVGFRRQGRVDMSPALETALEATSRQREEVVAHPCYGRLGSIESIRVFMEHHVFAVLDFMWLVKALQRTMTCVEVPWLPVGDAASRRFINEVVLAEESDEHGDGWLSHFELYRQAMEDAGADCGPIDSFVGHLRAGEPIADALVAADAPPAAGEFVLATSSTALTGRAHEIAAAFALGRETLIPAMFTSVLGVRDLFPTDLGLFVEYLMRHVDLDADVHTPLAFNLLNGLCGDDEQLWEQATAVARAALEARARLWDGVVAAIDARPDSDRWVGQR